MPSRPSLLAGLALGTAMTLVTAVAGVAAVIDQRDHRQARPAVHGVVESWIGALHDRDCEAYEALTTADFRDEIEQTSYECDTWRDAPDGSVAWTSLRLVDDGTTIHGDRAVVVVLAVHVHEYAFDDFIDTDPIRALLELRRSDGTWLLTDVQIGELQ